MGKLRIYLAKPATLNYNPWRVVTTVSLCVFLILLLAVDMTGGSPALMWGAIAAFTGVTAATVSLVGYVFPLIFPNFYDSRKWTKGRNIINSLIILMLISLGNSLLFFILFGQWDQWWRIVGGMTVSTLLIGIIPMIVVSYITSNNELRRNLRIAEELNGTSAAERVPTGDKETVKISGTTKDIVKVPLLSILYAESKGNYVSIYYLDRGYVRKGRVRNTIAQVETQLAASDNIIRCHRAFLVNKHRIVRAEGNAQGLELFLDAAGVTVPVSRNYVKVLRASRLGVGS